tara:strand:+ start:948 stop:1181 length:234 start_codon:yes stop_codon:yes gene_type:complete
MVSNEPIDQQNKIFDKIIECVLKGQIKEIGDLKLFGITEKNLQKEVMWKLFEEKVVSTTDKKEKHRLINKFHKANLL